jgi:hypothetical protein
MKNYSSHYSKLLWLIKQWTQPMMSSIIQVQTAKKKNFFIKLSLLH